MNRKGKICVSICHIIIKPNCLAVIIIIDIAQQSLTCRFLDRLLISCTAATFNVLICRSLNLYSYNISFRSSVIIRNTIQYCNFMLYSRIFRGSLLLRIRDIKCSLFLVRIYTHLSPAPYHFNRCLFGFYRNLIVVSHIY